MKCHYYYFTFGSEGQVYNGGWVKIEADSLVEAQAKFVRRYGEKARSEYGPLRYSDHYSEEQFAETSMAKTGNFGVRCHETIE